MIDLAIGLTAIIVVCFTFEWVIGKTARFLGFRDEEEEE